MPPAGLALKRRPLRLESLEERRLLALVPELVQEYTFTGPGAMIQELTAAGDRVYFFGSSLNSGEGLADFQEEVLVVAVSVGHAFEDFDFVVDAFEQAGVQGPAAVGENAVEAVFEIASEFL